MLQVTRGSGGEKIYRYGNLQLAVPKRFPQATLTGDEAEGALSFHTPVDANRFLEFFLIAWARQPGDWRAFLPVESQADSKGRRTAYEIHAPQQKTLDLASGRVSYERQTMDVVRRCGTKDRNNLLVCQFTSPCGPLRCPGEPRHFTVLAFSPRDIEKDFVGVLASLRCQQP